MINELAKKIYENKKIYSLANNEEILALVHWNLSKMFDRDNDSRDDALIASKDAYALCRSAVDNKEYRHLYISRLIGTFGDHMAVAVILLLGLGAKTQINYEAHINVRMRVNARGLNVANTSIDNSTINELSELIYKVHKQKGLHDNEKSMGEIVAKLHMSISMAWGSRQINDAKLISIGDKVNQELIGLYPDNDSDFWRHWKNISHYFGQRITSVLMQFMELAALMHIDLDSHIAARIRFIETLTPQSTSNSSIWGLSDRY